MSTSERSRSRRTVLAPTLPQNRLDLYLARNLPEYSRSYIQRLIENRLVHVNGNAAKPSQRLQAGDIVEVEFPPPNEPPRPEDVQLAVVYEDHDMLVVDKPAGMVVHPAPGHTSRTLVNAVLSHCPGLATSDDVLRPGIVHRLDKETSGLIVIAKHRAAKEYLMGQFKSRQVTKGYLALVKGYVAEPGSTIVAPVGRDPHNRKRMTVVAGGREAITRYSVRAYFDSYTLLDVSPTTGRTHQIRVHLAHIGHPVVNDLAYGGRCRDDRILLSRERHFLHAHRLVLTPPSTERRAEFTSPLPDDLRRTLGAVTEVRRLSHRRGNGIVADAFVLADRNRHASQT